MSNVSARPADRYVRIETTSTAKKAPTTEIEWDPRGVLLIRKGKCEKLYDVYEFPCGMDGRAFELAKDGAEDSYFVFLARNGQDSTCDCAGFTYTSNDPTGGRCCHLDAIKALIDAGHLTDPRHDTRPDAWPPNDPIALTALDAEMDRREVEYNRNRDRTPDELATEAGMNLPF